MKKKIGFGLAVFCLMAGTACKTGKVPTEYRVRSLNAECPAPPERNL